MFIRLAIDLAEYIDDVGFAFRIPVALKDEQVISLDQRGFAAAHVTVERLQLVELFPGIALAGAIDPCA